MPRKQGCSICRCLSMLVTLLLVAAGGYAAWFFLGQPSGDEILDSVKDLGDKIKEIDFGDFTDVLENFTGFTEDLFNEDPFVGDNTTNVWKGYTSGEGGLTLQLLNALDDKWQAEYAEAVGDWNTFCDPKVLVLTSKDVDVDYECSQVPGVMKVCNGNYLETGWLGINEVLKSVPQGIIQSSIAKMNEFYLLNADYDERLYTMCHELGHGYGLPHTDENFKNRDLGDCLDYTDNPSNNLRPGLSNCNRLQEMYGSVNINRGRRSRRVSQEQAQRALRYRSDAEIYEDETDYFDTDDSSYYYEEAHLQYPNMTAEYDAAMKELYYEIKQGSLMRKNQQPEEEDDVSVELEEERGREKWRRLRENSRGGDYSRRLNEGFVLEVHVLYPRDKN